MGYFLIEHKAKGKVVTHVGDDGKRTVVSDGVIPVQKRPHVSMSNGIMGGKAAKRAHQKLDAELGIRDCVEYVHRGHGAYMAKYPSVGAFDKWMLARQRVNHNAGYGTPAPGDFAGKD